MPLLEAIAAAQAGQGPNPGPTGMGLVRLGLERSRTARQAVEVIADRREIRILETAGTSWAAWRIASGVISISNTLSLRMEWDLAAPDLEGRAT